jgi:hypothetical protein
MNEKLSEAMDHISDKHIAEAAAVKNRRRYQIPAVIAAILALVLVIGIMLPPLKFGQNAIGAPSANGKYLLSSPNYPILAPYPGETIMTRTSTMPGGPTSGSFTPSPKAMPTL